MFRRSGFTYLLGVALVVSACKAKSQETPPAPAPAAAPATAPVVAAAPASPSAPAPVADDTLSFVEKAGDKCNWVRLEGSSGTRKNVFTFEGPCEAAQLAWSQDGRKGAVFQASEGERPARAWTVDLVTGQGAALPLPTVGLPTELGFDPEGRPVALTAHYELPTVSGPERVEEGGQEVFVFEGQKYPIGEVHDGSAGLAHAWRREGDAWKRVETKLSSFEGDASPETAVLDAVKTLGPSTALEERAGGSSQGVSPEEAAELAKAVPTKKAGTTSKEGALGNWARFGTTGGPLYHWAERIQVVFPSTPLRWRVEGKLVEPEKLALPEGARISLASRGDLLLVSTRQAARLYDAKQKKLLLSRDGVVRPSFWPRPGDAGRKPAMSTTPVQLSMKLDDSKVAVDFLKKSGVKLEEGKEDCSYLTEYKTVGKLVAKVLKDAKTSSVRCEPQGDTKTWACQADFQGRTGKGSEAAEFTLRLRYTVDDTTKALQPGSLVCNMAG